MVKNIENPGATGGQGQSGVPDVYHRAFADGFAADVPLSGPRHRSPLATTLQIGGAVLGLLAVGEGGARLVTGHWQPGQLDRWLAQFSSTDHHTGTTTTTGPGTGTETPTATPAKPELSDSQIQAEINAFHAATGHTYTDRVDTQTGAVTFVDVTAGNVDVATVNSTITINVLDKQGNITSTTTSPNLQFIGPKAGDTQPSLGKQLQDKLYSTQELGDKSQHTALNPFDLPPGAKLTIQVQPDLHGVWYIIQLPSGETLTITNPSATHNLVSTNDVYLNPNRGEQYNSGTLSMYDQNRRTSVETNLNGSFSQVKDGTYVAPGQVVGSGIPTTIDGQPPTAAVFSNDGVPVLPFTVGGIVVGGITQG